VIGGALGLLAGLGTIVLPGVGQFLVASPVFDAFAGAGALGVVGGFLGAVIGLGIPEFEAKRYEGRIKEGGVLLSVHCDTSEEIKRAKDLLKETGAQDIASTGEASADYAKTDKSTVSV
jgi:hypothetical protein